MSRELPIACTLSDAQLRLREATLLAQFIAEATVFEELEEGYGFRIPGGTKQLELVLELMSAERECCRFLAFNLYAAPDRGPLSLQISGPTGTKEFLKSLLKRHAPPSGPECGFSG